jgi:salicylate hydroxylase
MARNGFRVIVLEQAERLEETGAGIQLSPNATRALIELGLGERLRPHAVTPQGLRVLNAKNGREIVRMPLGDVAEQRYGAPYWSLHRGDLQAALSAAVAENLDISLRLGTRVDDYVARDNGVTVSAQSRGGVWHERGDVLIAADGLWSATRARMGFREPPRFAKRTAWRALVPVNKAAPEFREPVIHLWLGRETHIVHYPVKGGAVINIVVIMNDSWSAQGWSQPAGRDELLSRLSAERVAPQALGLINQPDAWLKWALFDRRPLLNWSRGLVALIGDAAHPMLPYLAQGAAMGIEDAVVAAQCLARKPDDPAAALRAYCAVRRGRTWKVQRLAARNGGLYHMGGIAAALRNATMRLMGGTHLLHHYDWLYDWRPPATLSIT